MNNKLHLFRVCLSYSYDILNIFFTLLTHVRNCLVTGCSSPHCKECQTHHSIHSTLSYIVECRETNVPFKSSSKLYDKNLELLQSRSLWQWKVSVYGWVCAETVSWVEFVLCVCVGGGGYNILERSVLVSYIGEFNPNN